MKTLILTLTLAFFTSVCFSQQNLLNSNESFVKDYLIKQGAFFKNTTYNDKGDKTLLFDYPLNGAFLLSAFFFTDKDVCYRCKYVYKENALEEMINAIKENKEYVKVPDKFIWVNKSRNCYIDFEIDRETGYVTMTFNFID